VFERIVGQDIAVRMLTHDVSRGTLPQVLLFHGPESAGKFLTGMELARVLNCECGGADGCTCPSCASVGRFASPNLFVLSGSNLRNTFTLWKTFSVTSSNHRFFLRDCRRFYLDIRNESRFAREAERVAGYLEGGEEFPEGSEGSAERRARDAVAVIDAALSVYSSTDVRVIGIDRIREVQRYLSMKSANGRPKVVIIDGAENMTEESANSFLRVSEDTPAGGTIVVIAGEKKRLKETIVSRCRAYRFKRHSPRSRETIMQNLGFDPAALEDVRGKRRSELLEQLRLIEDPSALYEAVQGIVSGGLALDLIEEGIERLSGRCRADGDLSPDDVEEVSGLLKKLSFFRRGILRHHMNVETALIDFLLNYYPKIVHLTGGRQSGGV
jgi:DNA polymerase III delta prime subunit